MFTRDQVINAWNSGWNGEFDKITYSDETFEKIFFKSAQDFSKKVTGTLNYNFTSTVKREFLSGGHRKFRNEIAKALGVNTTNIERSIINKNILEELGIVKEKVGQILSLNQPEIEITRKENLVDLGKERIIEEWISGLDEEFIKIYEQERNLKKSLTIVFSENKNIGKYVKGNYLTRDGLINELMRIFGIERNLNENIIRSLYNGDENKTNNMLKRINGVKEKYRKMLSIILYESVAKK